MSIERRRQLADLDRERWLLVVQKLRRETQTGKIVWSQNGVYSFKASVLSHEVVVNGSEILLGPVAKNHEAFRLPIGIGEDVLYQEVRALVDADADEFAARFLSETP